MGKDHFDCPHALSRVCYRTVRKNRSRFNEPGGQFDSVWNEELSWHFSVD